jgi:hypothetical protein
LKVQCIYIPLPNLCAKAGRSAGPENPYINDPTSPQG